MSKAMTAMKKPVSALDAVNAGARGGRRMPIAEDAASESFVELNEFRVMRGRRVTPCARGQAVLECS
jgi:hypothetical protein